MSFPGDHSERRPRYHGEAGHPHPPGHRTRRRSRHVPAARGGPRADPAS